MSIPSRTRVVARTQQPGNNPLQRSVVVHGGARDAYQLAIALSESGLLEALVTDLFWPADRRWAKWLNRLLPQSLVTLLHQRSTPKLLFSQVRLCAAAGLRSLLLDKIPRTPFSMRRSATRAADTALGRTAGELATQTGARLVSYSYFGFDAFSNFSGPGILFQAHPHPVTMRRILLEELRMHPECADSLQQEWELALPEEDFNHLVCEVEMASRFLAASSFTRNSLVEHGVPAESISVIPYGVDLDRFHPRAETIPRPPNAKLELLFVGRINQRKGVKYLLDALRLLNRDDVHLTICGRVVDSLELFRPFASQIDIRPSVSHHELVAAYQHADLFVFPSIAEGFGQVLLEALACGLPILSTTHTAAPDLIDDGIQGFIVEPRRPDLLAARIEWAIHHRAELTAMRPLARKRAEQFTWQRFRSGIVDAMKHSPANALGKEANALGEETNAMGKTAIAP